MPYGESRKREAAPAPKRAGAGPPCARHGSARANALLAVRWGWLGPSRLVAAECLPDLCTARCCGGQPDTCLFSYVSSLSTSLASHGQRMSTRIGQGAERAFWATLPPCQAWAWQATEVHLRETLLHLRMAGQQNNWHRALPPDMQRSRGRQAALKGTLRSAAPWTLEWAAPACAGVAWWTCAHSYGQVAAVAGHCRAGKTQAPA